MRALRRFAHFLLVTGAVLCCTGPLATVRRIQTIDPFLTTPTDPALIRLASTLSPGKRIRSAIAIDIDRDGDLDVIASTEDNQLQVWINERNHFSAAPAAEHAAMGASTEAVDSAGAVPIYGVLARSTTLGAKPADRIVAAPDTVRVRPVLPAFNVLAIHVPDSRLGRAPPSLASRH